MRYPSLKFFDKLNVADLPTGELAYYAYALTCCQQPASVVSGEWYQKVDDVCIRKIAELREEIKRRGDSHALAVLDGEADLVKGKKAWSDSINLAELSVCELVELHSMSRCWYDVRRRNKMEVFTRSYQWRIVNEMLGRKDSGILARILQLTEFIEADNYANISGLPYKVGDSITSFTPADFTNDEDLRQHISELSRKADHVSREELIQIADYIQTEIVEKGETAEHMDLVNAILCTCMPNFDYPVIVKDFEYVTKNLAKTKKMTDIELAPYFYNLWALTQKPTYLSRFEKAVRQCYLTLAANKHYPDLGVNKEDSDSLASALRFLDDYRINVWILNEKYDVDKVIAKYKTA